MMTILFMMFHVAREQKIHIGIGILEREGNKFYDSAILITPDKGIVLKYRRMTSGWHGKHANPKVYCEGNEFKKVYPQQRELK